MHLYFIDVSANLFSLLAVAFKPNFLTSETNLLTNVTHNIRIYRFASQTNMASKLQQHYNTFWACELCLSGSENNTGMLSVLGSTNTKYGLTN